MTISGPALRREGEILLRLKSHRDNPSRVEDFCDRFQASVVGRYALPTPTLSHQDAQLLHLKLDQPDLLDPTLEQLKSDPEVAYAEPNYLLFELKAPDDLDARLWGLHNQKQPGKDIHALEAWKIQPGTPGQGPVIAVLDSGCDLNHEDLAANLWRNPEEIPGNGIDDDGNGVIDDVHGFNAAASTGDPSDDGSHGTHVCGTVGAVGNNGVGVIGANPGAQIMPVKFLQGGYGDTADAIQGLLYATKMGARITSNSWGGVNYSQALYDVLASSPALHICAAGNSKSNNDIAPVYPAGYPLPNLIAVAATDENDELASFSNYGAESVHTAAPGDKIFSTLPGNQYGYKSGTSMATPHVSGVASLIVTEYPEISNQQLIDRLVFGVDRSPQLEGKVLSGGRLNAALALENDTIPPAAVRQLEVDPSGLTPFEVPLRWKATGDDGEEGQASAYEIRFSAHPIQSEEDFQRATPVAAPVPQAPGQPEHCQVRIHPRNQERRIHLAVRAVDNVGQRGPLASTSVLVPAAHVAFSGDAEAGASAWTATGTWGLQNLPGRGPVWTDSPYADYKEGENSSLTSQPFSLESFSQARLSFECRHDLEKIFDPVFLEISSAPDQWETLEKFEGRIGWEERGYDLAPYCGQQVQIRFRLKTDLDVCKDGFYLDKLVVTGTP